MQSQKSAVCTFSRGGNYCLYSSFPFKSYLPGTLPSEWVEVINKCFILLSLLPNSVFKLIATPHCQREGTGWTLTSLGRSNSEMSLLCLGEWWLKCICTFHLSKMLTYQAIRFRYGFFSGTRAEVTFSWSLLPEKNGFFIKRSKLKLAIG